MRSLTRAGGLLLSPLALGAATLLLVNDHLLKGWHGNWLTGKLSDLTGVFLLPLVMIAILEVVRVAARQERWVCTRLEGLVAVIVAGVGFTVVKTVGPAADAYAAAIGWIRATVMFIPRGDWVPVPIEVILDWTDLLVLPVLLGSWWVLARRAGQRTETLGRRSRDCGLPEPGGR